MSGATYADSDEKVNILLVDDQPANLVALEAILLPLGQNLIKATSGTHALRHLLQEDFAVILLDIQMQGMNGFETAQLIRGRDRSRHTPIIFLTAYESSSFPPTRAYSLGAVDYLIKPLVPEVLRAKVAGFVELYRKTVQIRRQAEQLRELQRKEFERELAARAREQEERFRLIVENIRDYAIFLLDPEGNVLTWNEGAERILGYRGEEILGQPSARFFTPEDIAAGLPQRELHTAATAGRSTDDNWLVRKDGNRFWASGVTTALRDGEVRGYVKILRDLTERKALEDQLRQRAGELAEAARHKDEFLAMLAHELRNPLGPILNSIHLARQPAATGPILEQALDMMERQTRHLARLLDDLLDVSRITEGRVHLRPERLDLARLVRVTAEDRRHTLEQAGLALTVQAPETPLWVRGDRTRLAQVLNNLLDNAAKFTDRGGRVEVRLAAGGATAVPAGGASTADTAVAPPGGAVLTVQDTGIGIPAEMLPRLFDVFTQGDRSLDRSRGGLGLGLAVVRGLVELHGGRIEAASGGPGKGAVFSIHLPTESEPAALAQAPSGPPARGGKHLRILVVEDNRDAATSLSLLLESAGHEVKVAHTGPEGVRLGEAWKPDTVLCDIGLPGMDGYDVARALRANPATARARMLALTGYGADEDRERSRQAGFNGHLVKPVDPVELQQILSA
jgi:PAS domain S-box-containing protein